MPTSYWRKENDMKYACVVGGSGFLGSHVADVLSEAGYSVRVYDKRPSSFLRNDQEMVIGNTEDVATLNKAVSGCEVVYNFSALADLDEAQNKPLETITINILGNSNVLEACRKNSVKRFIYASTVYVNSRLGGFYRCSKQAAEAYVEEYKRIYGLDYTILQYGSLYGPRSNQSNGIYRIIKNALESGAINYEGSCDAYREYIHVQDAARASVDALGREFLNQSIVLTGQEPMPVTNMLEMLAEILNLKQPIKFSNVREGHYIRTPYSYDSKISRKYVLPCHIDLGQGLLQLIREIDCRNAS